MNLTSQQRLILALFLAAGVMFVYSALFAPKGRPKPTPAKTPVTTTPAKKAPAQPAAAPPALIRSGARCEVVTPLYRATLQDGGLVALSLAEYPADAEQVIFSRLAEAPTPALSPLLAAGPGAKWSVDKPRVVLRGPRDRDAVTFTLRDGQGNVVGAVRYHLRGDDYELAATVTTTRPAPINLSLGSFRAAEGDDRRVVGEVSYDALADRAKVRVKFAGKDETKTFRGEVPWAALRSKYFILAVVASEGEELTVRRVKDASLAATYRLRGPGTYRVYAGPKRYFRLKDYGVGLERTVDLGWSIIGIIGALMLRLMYIVNGLCGNYGLTIIVFSVLIKILTYWPTAAAFRSSQKMQEIQPILQQIRARYKDDPQRQNAEMMAVYKKYKINPASGCLPMALQLPIFWALFNTLRNDIELKGAPFVLWIRDLSAPDVLFELPFTIPLVNIGTFNVLPLVMTALWVLQNQMTLPGKGGVKSEQQKIMAFMPVIFGFLFYNMPSGLVLYWTVNTLLTLGQQFIMMKMTRHREAEG